MGIIFKTVFATTLLLAFSGVRADAWMEKKAVARPFADVRDAVVTAIENRGLVVNYISHLGEMLERTGADIGTTRAIYAHAEIIEFCSASLSRQMMEKDPHNIVLCPFSVAVYSLPGEDQTTWIAYRVPKGSAASLVTPLISGVVSEAAQ